MMYGKMYNVVRKTRKIQMQQYAAYSVFTRKTKNGETKGNARHFIPNKMKNIHNGKKSSALVTWATRCVSLSGSVTNMY
jgi:guanylate kinase